MMHVYLSILPLVTWVALQAVSATEVGSFNIFAIIDKYGYPTLVSIVIYIIFSRQKKVADDERNGLMAQNNILTNEVLRAIRDGECKFSDEHNTKIKGSK